MKCFKKSLHLNINILLESRITKIETLINHRFELEVGAEAMRFLLELLKRVIQAWRIF